MQTMLQAVCAIYAEFLFSKARYAMAALFYDKCRQWADVIKCYELGHCPRELIAAYKMLDETTQTSLFAAYTSSLKKLAVYLEQHSQYEAQVEVLVELNRHEVGSGE